MPEPRVVALLAVKELRDARRNRWFLLFTATFAAVAVALSWLSVVGVSGTGYAGLGRTAAGLVHLVLLVVPLMGLVLASGALAGERERGSLAFLLAQPITAAELVLGKFAGLALALLASLLLGFGAAAAVLAAGGASGDVAAFLGFLGFAALLATAAVALGLLVSTLSARVSVAAGVALMLWLVLVLVGDLGLLGTAAALRMNPSQLLTAALTNPLQVFKVGALLAVRGGLEILGPAGLVASRELGGALAPVLALLLALWSAGPVAAACWVLERRGGVG